MKRSSLALLSISFLTLSFCVTGFAQGASNAASLQVSANHHWLQYAGGKPFFYLGDTAWHLFSNLTREQVDFYLSNRAAKGCTVIQACVLNDVDQANAYGDKPLVDRNPERPNEAYFRHADYIVNKAEQLGLFIGMLPTWGNNWRRHNAEPPYVFNAQNARSYGRFLGSRYRNKQIGRASCRERRER